MEPAILLFHGRGLISSLIRWQTRGQYSHAAFRLHSGQILESWQGDGVRIKSLTDWDGIDAYQVKGMTAEQWQVALEFAQRQIGKKYDYRAIIRFISREKMPSNERWFCSELVFAAMKFAGVNLLERIEAAAVSPALLAYSPLLTSTL